MSKERPILFSTPMVQAILAGRKTQTRRIIKPQPDEGGASYMKNPPLDWGNEEWKPWFYDTDEGERISCNCPYGQPGDILWVREMLYQDGDQGLQYVADNEWIDNNTIPIDHKPYRNFAHCNIPSIHMPHWACRLRLKITALRVERLNEISENDAIAEGILTSWIDPNNSLYHNYQKRFSEWGEKDYLTPRKSFQTLWESINGPGSWDANPWVWVIEFKPC